PAFASAHQKRRHAQFNAARTEYGSPAHAHQDTAGSQTGITAAEGQGTKFIGLAAVQTHGGVLSAPERHQASPANSHSNRAFWACSRLPACWKTMLRSPSRTSLVTSSPRWAGRQCITRACGGASASKASLTWYGANRLRRCSCSAS